MSSDLIHTHVYGLKENETKVTHSVRQYYYSYKFNIPRYDEVYNMEALLCLRTFCTRTLNFYTRLPFRCQGTRS